MDEDLDILIPEDKFLSIGKKKFKIWISSERSLKAVALFNRINKEGSEEREKIETDYDFYYSLLDVAMLLIKQDLKPVLEEFPGIKTFISWVKRERLTKRYILQHLDIKQLESFIDDALDPIIGSKKKVLERQNKTADAMMILMDTITPEQLAILLQNSLQVVDIPNAM